jgi:hypothetical protein
MKMFPKMMNQTQYYCINGFTQQDNSNIYNIPKIMLPQQNTAASGLA